MRGREAPRAPDIGGFDELSRSGPELVLGLPPATARRTVPERLGAAPGEALGERDKNIPVLGGETDSRGPDVGGCEGDGVVDDRGTASEREDDGMSTGDVGTGVASANRA